MVEVKLWKGKWNNINTRSHRRHKALIAGIGAVREPEGADGEFLKILLTIFTFDREWSGQWWPNGSRDEICYIISRLCQVQREKQVN